MKSKKYDADTDKRSSREKLVDWTAQKNWEKDSRKKDCKLLLSNKYGKRWYIYYISIERRVRGVLKI